MLSISQPMTAEKKGRNKSFEDILSEKGYLIYTAKGVSMMPLIRQNRDIIEIRPNRERIKKYEIALYKRGKKYILHRCLCTSPYIFAGDHNTFKEYDVTEEMILGVMTRIIRNGKSIYPTNLFYRIYAHLWVDFFPVKVFILKAKAKCRFLIHKLKFYLTNQN